MIDPLDTFPTRVRMIMADRQLTCARVGKSLGLSAQAISKWQRGKALPRSSELVAFAKLVDCSLDWLMAPESVDFRWQTPKDES